MLQRPVKGYATGGDNDDDDLGLETMKRLFINLNLQDTHDIHWDRATHSTQMQFLWTVISTV